MSTRAVLILIVRVVDVLLDLSCAFAIPVAIAVVLTSLFLVSTMVLPTHQSFPFSLRQSLLGSFIELASTVTNSEYVTSIFNAHPHLEDPISVAPYLTRSAEHSAEQQMSVSRPSSYS